MSKASVLCPHRLAITLASNPTEHLALGRIGRGIRPFECAPSGSQVDAGAVHENPDRLTVADITSLIPWAYNAKGWSDVNVGLCPQGRKDTDGLLVLSGKAYTIHIDHLITG